MVARTPGIGTIGARFRPLDHGGHDDLRASAVHRPSRAARGVGEVHGGGDHPVPGEDGHGHPRQLRRRRGRERLRVAPPLRERGGAQAPLRPRLPERVLEERDLAAGADARAIWIATPRAVVANTPAATATAVVVPGGYRVTGRQGFSTGCRHASWVAAHAQILDNGTTRLERGQPETRYFFVPVAEAQILDTWKVRGMRGTGTHHFAVHDVFVPAERTVLSATAPLLHDGPLYRIPRTLAFASGDAAVALGMSRSCLEAFFDLAGSKTPRAVQGLLRDQSMTQGAVGHAEAA